MSGAAGGTNSAHGMIIPHTTNNANSILSNENYVRNPRPIAEGETIIIRGVLGREEEDVGYDNLKYVKYRVLTNTSQALLIFRINGDVNSKSAAGGAENPVEYMIVVDGDIYEHFIDNVASFFKKLEDYWNTGTSFGTVTITRSGITQAGGKRKRGSRRKSKKQHKTRKGRGRK